MFVQHKIKIYIFYIDNIKNNKNRNSFIIKIKKYY